MSLLDKYVGRILLETKQKEIMNNQFKQALELLRDLADMQNGAPLMRYEKQYNEVMQQVYDFLNQHEVPIEESSSYEEALTRKQDERLKERILEHVSHALSSDPHASEWIRHEVDYQFRYIKGLTNPEYERISNIEKQKHTTEKY